MGSMALDVRSITRWIAPVEIGNPKTDWQKSCTVSLLAPWEPDSSEITADSLGPYPLLHSDGTLALTVFPQHLHLP